MMRMFWRWYDRLSGNDLHIESSVHPRDVNLVYLDALKYHLSRHPHECDDDM